MGIELLEVAVSSSEGLTHAAGIRNPSSGKWRSKNEMWSCEWLLRDWFLREWRLFTCELVWGRKKAEQYELEEEEEFREERNVGEEPGPLVAERVDFKEPIDGSLRSKSCESSN